MPKKINFGSTSFNELHQILGLESHEQLTAKRPRLFPIGNTINENPTTSIFLASLCAVKEYREKLLNDLGISKITNYNVELHTFTELSNKDNGDRPDGLIVLTSGKNPIIEWACFVESKVKNNEVEDNQVEKYSDFARDIGINDIVTISNVLVASPFQSPNKIKKNKFNLYHWSWSYLSVLANMLVRNNMIEDTDHIFILKELRRYFDDHNNINHFDNMGKDWKDSVSKFLHYELNQKIDSKIIDFISKAYSQEEKDISLHLTDKSSSYIELISKGDRITNIKEELGKKHKIVSNYSINLDKKNTFEIEVNFLKKEIKCCTCLTISKGKAQSQTTSLLKMFENEAGITDKIIVESYYPRNKKVDKIINLSQLLSEKEKSIPYSNLNKEFGDEIKEFRLKTVDMIGKDITSPKNFIIKLEEIAIRFLTQVVNNRKNI